MMMNMNFDQIPSKFAPVSSRILDIRGTLHVATAGMSYKHFSKPNFVFVIVCYSSHFLLQYILFAKFVLLCEPLHNLGPAFLFSPFQYSETVDGF